MGIKSRRLFKACLILSVVFGAAVGICVLIGMGPQIIPTPWIGRFDGFTTLLFFLSGAFMAAAIAISARADRG